MIDQHTDETDVLVVGAGPTGLTLACELRRRGVNCRVVEQAPQFPTSSRGKGIQPRTLEVLADLGVVDSVLSQGRSRHVRVRTFGLASGEWRSNCVVQVCSGLASGDEQGGERGSQ